MSKTTREPVTKSVAVDKCILEGDGLAVATTGVEASFTIKAVDLDGTPKQVGGDDFFVFVRGPDRVRAKVVDQSDGTYRITWKAFTSGYYKISVSHFGEHLPNSPFTLYVYHPHPHAPNCVVSGKGLTHAVAREPVSFNMSFRDKLGQLANAPTELDCFVELVKAGDRPEQFKPKAPSPTGMAMQQSSIDQLMTNSVPEALHVNFAFPEGPPSPLIKLPRKPRTQSERAIEKLKLQPWADNVLPGPLSPTGETSEEEDQGQRAATPSPPRSPVGSPRERERLNISSLQQHKQLWSRRELLNKVTFLDINGVARSRGTWGYREKSAHTHELDSDPMGFAYGGIYPGASHALVENHKVSYSIGLAGTYRLHVRLRAEALPVPGSPFDLVVSPGWPNGQSSFIDGRIKSIDGRLLGCTLLTCDVMGNACTHGGARVECKCSPAPADFNINDLSDGLYEIEWRAPRGMNDVEIKLDGIHILGSPFKVDGGSDNRNSHDKRRGSSGHLTQSAMQREGRAPVASVSTAKMLDSFKATSTSSKDDPPSVSNSQRGKRSSVGFDPKIFDLAQEGQPFRGNKSGLSKKELTVPIDPVTATRKRMSMGLSGMALPEDFDLYGEFSPQGEVSPRTSELTGVQAQAQA